MSVFRQPGVLGRSTRRRVVGVTAALSAAAVEMLAVGCWFVLVVDSRTTSTALAGLGVLFCGSLLRAGVFGATVSDIDDLLQPRRLGVTIVLTTGWIVWLLVAELIGAVPGVVVATGVLAGILTGQFLLERRVFGRYASTRVTFTPVVFTPVVSGLLMAVGASALLATAWFTDWSLSSPPVSLGVTTVVLEIEALHLGVLVFGLFAFLSHQYRFQRVLGP